ncbi:MAG: hypothetical protein ACOCRA_04270 [Halobacteria archaeon]
MEYSKEIVLAVLLVAFISGYVFFGAVLPTVASLVFGDDWEEPEPSIESVEVTRAGCHDDVRGKGMSSSDGTWIGTVNGTSPHTVVSAEIRHVSPDRADVTTYRLDVETHNTSVPAPDYDCDADEGAVRYEISYDAPSPDGATGHRIERYLNGELKGCGGSTSDPDIGCVPLHEEAETHWSNVS